MTAQSPKMLARLIAAPRSARALARYDAVSLGVRYAEELGEDLLVLLDDEDRLHDCARRVLETWRRFRPLDVDGYYRLCALIPGLERRDAAVRVALRRAGLSSRLDDPVVVDGDRERLAEHIDRLSAISAASKAWLLVSGGDRAAR